MSAELPDHLELLLRRPEPPRQLPLGGAQAEFSRRHLVDDAGRLELAGTLEATHLRLDQGVIDTVVT